MRAKLFRSGSVGMRSDTDIAPTWATSYGGGGGARHLQTKSTTEMSKLTIEEEANLEGEKSEISLAETRKILVTRPECKGTSGRKTG